MDCVGVDGSESVAASRENYDVEVRRTSGVRDRYYDPETGRYVISDPIGLGGGLNTFGYVYQNPLMYSDINGLCPPSICTSHSPIEQQVNEMHRVNTAIVRIISESTPYAEYGVSAGPKYQGGPFEASGGVSSTLRITPSGVSSVEAVVGVEGSVSGNRNGAGSVNASGGISVTQEGVALIRPGIGGSASKGAASTSGSEVGIGFTTTPTGGVYLGIGFILPNPQRRNQIIGQIFDPDCYP